MKWRSGKPSSARACGLFRGCLGFGCMESRPIVGALGRRGAIGFIEAADELIEPAVGAAALARQHVPFGRLHRIGLEAAAGGQDARDTILGDDIAALGRDEEPLGADFLVLLHAIAAKYHDAIFES